MIIFLVAGVPTNYRYGDRGEQQSRPKHQEKVKIHSSSLSLQVADHARHARSEDNALPSA
jgi:hypothetical protein